MGLLICANKDVGDMITFYFHYSNNLGILIIFLENFPPYISRHSYPLAIKLPKIKDKRECFGVYLDYQDELTK